MSKIHDAIVELRHAPGVKGAAVVTNDGLVAASSLATGIDPDVISGLSSYLMMTTNRSLTEGSYGACTKLLLNATHGKAVLVQLDESYLVVLFDQFAEIAQADREVDETVARIRRASKLA
ncbi:MAG: putative regulator of Ras-like GTPase activity (Roadblock/LC7/MglB family) [Planctomycetota bacterium]|jgi:predicted regulator of Ras-like GTPase activity (Roadblock/LC7/MglB family)